MDDNQQQNNKNTNKQPNFLSRENTNVLQNLDISTTPTPIKTSFINLNSIKGNSSNDILAKKDDEVPPTTYSNQPANTQVVSPFAQPLYRNVQESTIQPASVTHRPITEQKTPEPIKKVIVTEKHSTGIIGRLFIQLFNCLGCFLFILGIIIIAFMYIINF